EPADDQRLRAVDDNNLGWRADVRVDDVSLLVVDGPARPAWQRQLPDHAHRVEVDERGGAVLAERFPQVEAVQPPAAAVVGEPVRVWPDLDLPEQLLIGAAEHADAGC